MYRLVDAPNCLGDYCTTSIHKRERWLPLFTKTTTVRIPPQPQQKTHKPCEPQRVRLHRAEQGHIHNLRCGYFDNGLRHINKDNPDGRVSRRGALYTVPTSRKSRFAYALAQTISNTIHHHPHLSCVRRKCNTDASREAGGRPGKRGHYISSPAIQDQKAAAGPGKQSETITVSVSETCD